MNKSIIKISYNNNGVIDQCRFIFNFNIIDPIQHTLVESLIVQLCNNANEVKVEDVTNRPLLDDELDIPRHYLNTKSGVTRLYFELLELNPNIICSSLAKLFSTLILNWEQSIDEHRHYLQNSDVWVTLSEPDFDSFEKKLNYAI